MENRAAAVRFNNNNNNNNNNNRRNTNNRNVRNSNLNSFSQRPSRLFAITVTYVQVSKLHVYYSLEDLCFRLLIAEEKHYNQHLHHHIYMRTKEKLTIVDVYDIINRVYDRNQQVVDHLHDQIANCVENSEPIDGVLVQTVRNERTYLKYITKSDKDPMFKSIDQNMLSFFYTTLVWAQNTSKFDYADAYVLNNPQYYKLLEKVHSSVQNSKKIRRKMRLMPYYMPLDQNQSNTWQEEVINWWNDWIVNGYRHKKPQLFLWGGSNTGKTTFVRHLIRQSTGFKSLNNDNNNNNNNNTIISIRDRGQRQEIVTTMSDNNESFFTAQVQDHDSSILSSSSLISNRVVFEPTPTTTTTLVPIFHSSQINQSMSSQTHMLSTTSTANVDDDRDGSHDIHNDRNVQNNDEDDDNDDDDDDEDYFENQIFCPTPNEKRFAWQDFDVQLHNLVVIDEFEISEYNVTDLKKVLAGESLVVNRKGECSKKIKLKMPMIIISNLPPPASDVSTQMQGVIQRLKVVRADRLIIS